MEYAPPQTTKTKPDILYILSQHRGIPKQLGPRTQLPRPPSPDQEMIRNVQERGPRPHFMVFRELTNTPEILSPTTKTPTQCLTLSPAKWLPRYGTPRDLSQEPHFCLVSAKSSFYVSSLVPLTYDQKTDLANYRTYYSEPLPQPMDPATTAPTLPPRIYVTMPNWGNTCFLNSAVQYLVTLYEWLRHHHPNGGWTETPIAILHRTMKEALDNNDSNLNICCALAALLGDACQSSPPMLTIDIQQKCAEYNVDTNQGDRALDASKPGFAQEFLTYALN
eukprot:g70320.t1